MQFTKNSTISEIIISNIKAALIFENYNLNYSTEGMNTLSKACDKSGIQTGKLVKELNRLNGNGSGIIKLHEWNSGFLCDYIEMNHHSYIRRSLPKIISTASLLSKKDKKFGIIKIKLTQLSMDFEIHMQKEERLLFPYIKYLVKMNNDGIKFEMAPFGPVANIIKVMEKEHSEADNIQQLIRKNCNNYKPSKNDDPEEKKFYQMLKEFETDLHIHVHLENYLLFPAAVNLEKKLKHRKKTIIIHKSKT